MRHREEYRDESYDLLNQYLQEIARIPRLSPEDERELGRRVQQNDRSALEHLVKANLRFVVSYAKRFRNTHVLFLDLINEGNIGLIQAAKKFDPDKNVKFITYAVWWIRQAILHALSQQGGAFRLPPKRANLMYRLDKAIGGAMSEGNPVPTAEELATELGVSVKEVQTLLDVSAESFSLSSELDSESHTELSEVIEQQTVRSAEEEMAERAQREELLKQISDLSPKERLVLTLRHGVSDNIPRPIAQIAELLGRGNEEIRTIISQSTETLCRSFQISESELAELLLYMNPNPKARTQWQALKDRGEQGAPIRFDVLAELAKLGAVQNAVDQLPLDDRTILKLRYGIVQDEELTLRDIGEILKLSRERVRQIEANAERKCRRGKGGRRGRKTN